MKRLILTVLLLALLLSSAALAEGFEVGDTLFFGSYEQDNDAANGWEPIEWYVLDKKADGSYMLISRYALDCKSFRIPQTAETWETSLLRTWLNEEFFARAFDSEEQKKVVLTWVEADREFNPAYDPGGDTLDRVFLLNTMESSKYLEDKDYC